MTVNEPLRSTQLTAKRMGGWGEFHLPSHTFNQLLLEDASEYICFCGSSLALTAMNKYPEAISYFKKALVLDPENDTYKSNLKIAEQKHKEASSPVSSNRLHFESLRSCHVS